MRVAAVTFVRNEFDLLPVWLKYYYSQVDEIYVMNPAKEKYPGEFHEVFYEDEDNSSIEQARDQVHRLLEKLIKEFDWIVYGDADEFVVPDPAKYKGLRDFLQFQDQDVIYCSGYDILQDNLPALDFSKPLLEQRKRWTPAHPYNKPIVFRKIQDWADGWHYTKPLMEKANKANVDLKEAISKVKNENLYLIHLKRACVDLYNRRQGVNGGHRGDWMAWLDQAVEIPERFKVI